MKKLVYLIILILSSSYSTFAQKQKGKPVELHSKHKNSAELGVFLGGSYYIGDLNPSRQFVFTKPAGGLMFRYNFNPRIAARASFMVGSIEGHDSYSNSASQKQRNLNFKSMIDEFSVQFDFNFLDYRIGLEKEKFSPYIFVGLAVFNFNPQGQLANNNYVSLQPMRTEGEGLDGGSMGKPYKLTQISIPFGIGFKTNVSRKMGITGEWGFRKTFTDYLDDVSGKYYNPNSLSAQNAAYLSDPSKGTDPNYGNVGRQRGNATTKDWYVFAGIIISFELKQKREKCPGFK